MEKHPTKMTAIRNYYYVIPSSSTNHARQQVFHVFSETNGNYLFSETVPICRVTGNNYTKFPPIGTKYVKTMYWRSSFATLLQDTSSFGTLYCPEIISMNTTNDIEYQFTEVQEILFAPSWIMVFS